MKERMEMRKMGLYIEDAEKYYKKRYQKRKRNRRIAKAVFTFLLAVVIGCSTIDMVIGEGSSKQAATVMAQPLESVSGGDMETNVPIMDGNLWDTVSGGDAGRTDYLESTARDVVKEPEDILVVIDPGHGGDDEGCSRKEVQEKDVNLQIARAVQTKLEEQGYQVLLTREGDTTLTLEERVETANEARGDIYISIHQNACEYSNVRGTEVWYSTQNEGEESERLAKLIHKYMVEETGAVDREVVEDETLYVIRECTMPSCLVETGFLSNAAERGNLVSQEYQEQIAEGIVNGINLFFRPKTMYLTFDDGPSEENTNAVLDILKKHNIKATFFVVGENVEKHPDVARRIVEEGHTIGIHCNNHAYETLYDSADSFLADFEEAYNTVYEVTGVEAKLFRFPGGSINAYNRDVYEDIIKEMTDRGFIYYDWNASLEDAVKKTDADKLLKNARESTLGRKKVVMLAHDVVYQTTLCLDDLIEQFPEYRMEPLTEDVEPIQF